MRASDGGLPGANCLAPGILAQCCDPWLAACAGVLVHARAGDALARRDGARGLLAGDVAAALTVEANRGE